MVRMIPEFFFVALWC